MTISTTNAAPSATKNVSHPASSETAQSTIRPLIHAKASAPTAKRDRAARGLTGNSPFCRPQLRSQASPNWAPPDRRRASPFRSVLIDEPCQPCKCGQGRGNDGQTGGRRTDRAADDRRNDENRKASANQPCVRGRQNSKERRQRARTSDRNQLRLTKLWPLAFHDNTLPSATIAIGPACRRSFHYRPAAPLFGDAPISLHPIPP